MTAFTLRLERSAQLLASRLERLEARLQDDDAAVWTEYRETAAALAQVFAHVAPGRRGELLTTEQMAERLNLSPKTLLKRKARGELRPALQRGKLICWRGDEVAAQ
jgi:hypothetical protein